jgi:hypothetical protein
MSLNFYRAHMQQFVRKRSQGAKKIEDAAMAKGGYAKLTGVHFKAKEVPYRVCGKYIKGEDLDSIKEKGNECMRRLKGWEGMSQYSSFYYEARGL